MEKEIQMSNNKNKNESTKYNLNDLTSSFQFLSPAIYNHNSKFNLKLWILKYFDHVINKIDMDAEIILYDNKNLTQKEVNKIRNEFIKEAERIQASNLNKFDTELNIKWDKIFKSGNNSSLSIKSIIDENDKRIVEIKRSIFKEFCIYIEKDLVNILFNDEKKFPFGILITTDFYINDAFMECLNTLIDTEKVNIQSSFVVRITKKQINELCNLEMCDLQIKTIKKNVFEKLKMINLKHLDISSNKIEVIKKNMLSLSLQNLTELNLSSNQIESIEDNSFNSLKNLKTLNLGLNKINRLSEDTFTGLTKLSQLDLSRNAIKSIKGGLFTKLPNLNKLNLSTNKFEIVHMDSFRDLKKLEILCLCYNINKNSYLKIKILEKEAFNELNSLKELFLSNQMVENIENDSFNKLINLEKLVLKSNDTKIFDKNCFAKLKKLKKLLLNGSFNFYKSDSIQLKKSFFKYFGNNLEELDLTEYKIDSIDLEAFFYLNNLKVLKLSNNYITSISVDHLKYLTNLKVLDLSFNKLTNLDEYLFSNLNNLEELILKNNQIESVHFKAFMGLFHLKILNLSDNPFCSIQSGTFNCLEGLQRLDLSKTNIRKLKFEYFEKLIKLEDLNLRSLNFNNSKRIECRLCIEKNTFSNLVNLKSLNLQSNSIKNLNKNLLNGLNNLEELNVSFNLIETIEPDSLKHLIKLKELFLNNNQINDANDSNLFNETLGSTLQVLDLSDNLIDINLNSINLFGKLINLKSLSLINNNINENLNQDQYDIQQMMFNLLPTLIDFSI